MDKNSKNQAYATGKSHVTSNLIITDGPNIYLIVQPHFCLNLYIRKDDVTDVTEYVTRDLSRVISVVTATFL